MKKEWLLAVLSTGLSVLVAVALLRWFAPQLLGLPVDLQMVRVSDKVVPFFDSVFRAEDYADDQFILRDPYLSRARPLYPDSGEELGMGPNDILGFRNRAVPNITDILCIGDSQTYGNNAVLEENWPNQLQGLLAQRHAQQYSMAVGGWGAVEYLEILPKALLLRPRVIIVAFYTGNDPIDSFVRAYGNPRWQSLRPNPGLSAGDAPAAPPGPPELWPVTFADGVETVFSPRYRLLSNQAHPAVAAGYAIMAKVAEQLLSITQAAGQTSWYAANGGAPRLVFTIIPTKELAYARKLEQSGITRQPAYAELLAREQAHIETLRAQLQQLSGAVYADVIGPLQEAALQARQIYPVDSNGHPVGAGYGVIAEALRAAVTQALPVRPALAMQVEDSGSPRVFLLSDRRWEFASPQLALANGWPLDAVPRLLTRDIEALPRAGLIQTVKPARFGPRAFP